jgi:hypothetical protein
VSTDLQIETSTSRLGRASAWAPWWTYVLVIVPANLGKEQLLPSGIAWWARGALTAAVVVGGIALVTALYRAGREVRVP